MCYQFCTFKNLIFSTHFYLGVWLPPWLLSPLYSLFFSPSISSLYLYLFPSLSIFYITLRISLGVLGCGEHSGNWLLASLISPLLIPTILILVTSISLLPPPSLLYPTLWISLCVLGCGEHLGNWLLAESVSLLLIPPFVLLVTSVSLLPLLFSM